MTGPFAQWATSYKARGFSPLPVNPGQHFPSFGGKYNLKKWQVYAEGPATDWQIGSWARSHEGLGLCLATGYGGLIAIDVDDCRAYAAVREVFAHLMAPTKIGRRGATAFFHDPTGEIKNRNIYAENPEPGKLGGVLVEVLAKKRATLIPPTIHHKTNQPYRWHNASLEDLSPADLPIITQDHLAQLDALLEPISAKRKQPVADIDAVRREINLGYREKRRYEAYANAVLFGQAADLGNEKKGGRGRKLFNAACCLGRWVHHGFLSASDVRDALVKACEMNGLVDDNGESDVVKTIQNGLNFSKNDELPIFEEEGNRWHKQH